MLGMAGLGPLGKVAEMAEGAQAMAERIPMFGVARRVASWSSMISVLI